MGGPAMIVDCMTCPVRGRQCEGCVVTALSAPRTAEHLAPTGQGSPAGPGRTPDSQCPPSFQCAPDRQRVSESQWTVEIPSGPGLRLDAAEQTVVSMFVGAGLVSLGAAAGLRARRESVQQWGSARNVG